jgi:plastocyanin
MRMVKGIAIIVIMVAIGGVILGTNWNQMSKIPPAVSSIALQPPNEGANSESQGASSATTSPSSTTGTTSGGTGSAGTSTPAGTTASTPTTPTTAAAAATLTIPVGAQTQGNPSYQPASLTVKKGDVIAVVNKDSAAHTVTNGKGPDDPNAGKQFDTSIISHGQSAKVDTASLAPGEYDFHCAVHPFMSGKLKVQ